MKKILLLVCAGLLLALCACAQLAEAEALVQAALEQANMEEETETKTCAGRSAGEACGRTRAGRSARETCGGTGF